jgi:hypothetical protein
VDIPASASEARKPLPQHATEVEHETQSEPGMGKPKPLKGGLRQDKRLGVLECDDVRRPRKPVEEPHFAEEVTGLERPNAPRPVVGGDQHLERAARDDEEASVDFALMDGELALRVEPCLCVLGGIDVRTGGTVLVALFPGDVGPGDDSTARTFQITGNNVARVEDDVITSFDFRGQIVDICAMIA